MKFSTLGRQLGNHVLRNAMQEIGIFVPQAQVEVKTYGFTSHLPQRNYFDVTSLDDCSSSVVFNAVNAPKSDNFSILKKVIANFFFLDLSVKRHLRRLLQSCGSRLVLPNYGALIPTGGSLDQASNIQQKWFVHQNHQSGTHLRKKIY